MPIPVRFLMLLAAPALGAQQATVWEPVPPAAPAAPVAVAAPQAAPAPWVFGADGTVLSLTSGQAPALFGPQMRSFPQDPADSLYRAARTLLNRGEYRKAADAFARVADHRPSSAFAADALYWQAFALYRIGATTDLRNALGLLEARRTRYPNARSESEAATLATRIRGALAARGDQAAQAALAREAQAGTAGCDSEELSVRASALSALQRSDPEAAAQLVDRILARRDECSVPLRRNAVMMIGSKGDASARTRLANTLRNDPSAEVRSEAVGYLARVSGEEAVPALEAVIRNDDEEDRVRRAAVRALGNNESPRARTALRALVERASAPEALRLEAISAFDRSSGWSYAMHCDEQGCAPLAVTAPDAPTPPAPPARPARVAGAAAPVAPAVAVPGQAVTVVDAGGARALAPSGQAVSITSGNRGERRITAEDAAWLRGLFPRLETQRLRSRAIQVLSRAQDEATQTWLAGLITREQESPEVRATVLSRLGMTMPIASLGRLYDNASDRQVRSQIISTLGSRSEPEATDKLIEIVRTGTDPQLRRSAISALGRKKDPRTTQLLLELIDR